MATIYLKNFLLNESTLYFQEINWTKILLKICNYSHAHLITLIQEINETKSLLRICNYGHAYLCKLML